jgi:predicted ATPase
MEERLSALNEALDVVEEKGERWFEAELHRLKGETLLVRREQDQSGAELCFQRALAVARKQGAKLWEFRAATSLGHLWRDSAGRKAEANELLRMATADPDTPDLKDSKTLLDRVGE